MGCCSKFVGLEVLQTFYVRPQEKSVPTNFNCFGLRHTKVKGANTTRKSGQIVKNAPALMMLVKTSNLDLEVILPLSSVPSMLLYVL